MPKGDVARRSNAVKNNRGDHKKATRFTPEAAKANLILHVQEGLTIEAALEKVDRVRSTYERWRSDDKDFAARVDQAKKLKDAGKGGPAEKISFAEWRKKYLKTETFWHQHQWIDILEGRDPRDLHSSQTYHPGKKSRVLINVPPFHAKSMTITMQYTVYRICMDPGFRCIIVSAGSTLAQDFLYGIKQILTHPDYIDLQMAYAPEGGWKQSAEAWSLNRITVGAVGRDSSEKDPTVQAIGMGGQIYGTRADMVIVDDAVLGKNVREWEKQMKWLRREVSSRIEAGGKLLVIGTRIAPVDLYSELMNPDHYANGKVPWTHFASPAILEEGPDHQHQTLWPYSDRPWQESGSEDTCDCGLEECSQGEETEDGTKLYPRWDGLHLDIGPRADNNAAEWALIYQQTSLHENMTFPQFAVEGSTNTRRLPGRLDAENHDHPRGGMHNMYVFGGCDPSVKGFAGLVAYAVDKTTLKRYLLAVRNLKAPTPAYLKSEMKEMTELYDINEWRVEKTGLLQFFTQDEELRSWMTQNGIKFKEHLTTGQTKWDPTYGVASMSTLFGAWEEVTDERGRASGGGWTCRVEPQIELPRPITQPMQALVHQLVTWTPETDPKRIPCDLVMALWFAETGAREMTAREERGQRSLNPFKNALKFTSARDRKNRIW